MQTTAEARADPAFPAGHALILVRGAARAAADPRFVLRRSDGYDQAVLGPAGWQVAADPLTPRAATAIGDDLELSVGPSVANHLDMDTYQIALPSAGLAATIVWPNIAPSYDGSRSRAVIGRRAASPPPAPAPAPMVAPPLADMDDATVIRPVGAAAWTAPPDATVVARTSSRISAGIPDDPGPALSPFATRPTPASDTRWAEQEAALPRHPREEPSRNPVKPTALPPRRPSVLVPVLVGLMFVLALAGAAYVGYLWWGPGSAPQTAAAAPTPAPPPASSGSQLTQTPATQPPATQPAAPGAATGLEMMAVTEAIARADTPALIQREAERRLGANRPDDALLMLEVAADRGHAPAKAMLGRFYDPNQPRQGGIRPDARQAARYYREAARGGDNSIDTARAALRASLTEQTRRGDANATLILQDFWP